MTDLDLADDLHDLMDRALTDLPTPVERLHEGGVRGGRRVRRRRRAAAAVGTLAAATIAGLLVVPALAGTDPESGQVAHDTSRPTPRADVPAGWWDMPGRVMERRLEGLLPSGLTVTDADLGNDELAPGEEPHGGWVEIDVADADGEPAGALNVLLYAPQPADNAAFVRQRITCPGDLEDPATPCTEAVDESGDPVGRTVRWRTGDVIVLEVTRLLPDGGMVYAATSNSSDDKWGEGSSVDSDSAPTTVTQLAAIAQAPTWQDWIPRPSH